MSFDIILFYFDTWWADNSSFLWNFDVPVEVLTLKRDKALKKDVKIRPASVCIV